MAVAGQIMKKQPTLVPPAVIHPSDASQSSYSTSRTSHIYAHREKENGSFIWQRRPDAEFPRPLSTTAFATMEEKVHSTSCPAKTDADQTHN